MLPSFISLVLLSSSAKLPAAPVVEGQLLSLPSPVSSLGIDNGIALSEDAQLHVMNEASAFGSAPIRRKGLLVPASSSVPFFKSILGSSVTFISKRGCEKLPLTVTANAWGSLSKRASGG